MSEQKLKTTEITQCLLASGILQTELARLLHMLNKNEQPTTTIITTHSKLELLNTVAARVKSVYDVEAVAKAVGLDPGIAGDIYATAKIDEPIERNPLEAIRKSILEYATLLGATLKDASGIQDESSLDDISEEGEIDITKTTTAAITDLGILSGSLATALTQTDYFLQAQSLQSMFNHRFQSVCDNIRKIIACLNKRNEQPSE